VLTSLAGGPRHGYAITQDVAAQVGVRLAPGTLYGAIGRLEERGFIEPLPAEKPAAALPDHGRVKVMGA
jgi:DNA-binding PadR family transcriptional regulator